MQPDIGCSLMEVAMLAVFEVTLSLRTMTEATNPCFSKRGSRPLFETFDISAAELTRVCHVGEHTAEDNDQSEDVGHLLRA